MPLDFVGQSFNPPFPPIVRLWRTPMVCPPNHLQSSFLKKRISNLALTRMFFPQFPCTKCSFYNLQVRKKKYRRCQTILLMIDNDTQPLETEPGLTLSLRLRSLIHFLGLIQLLTTNNSGKWVGGRHGTGFTIITGDRGCRSDVSSVQSSLYLRTPCVLSTTIPLDASRDANGIGENTGKA